MSAKRKSADVADEGQKPAKHAHKHTNVQPTGLGQQISSAPGRLAQGPLQELCSSHPAAKWAPHAVPQSACPSNPAAAVELELARAAALDTLRHKLASLCAKAGLRNVPLLAFERWRFAAKWAEDEPQLAMGVDTAADPASSKQGSTTSSKKGSRSSSRKGADPVLPFGHLPVAPEPGLVSDLMRAGLPEEAAAEVALQLADASASAAAAVSKRQHQLASGKAPSCPDMKVAFYKHSLDLTCGSKFVKVSRASYGKLARLYRMSGWSTSAAAAQSTVGLPLDQAAAKLQTMQAAATAEGQTTTPAAGGSESSSSEDEQSDDPEGAGDEHDDAGSGRAGETEAKRKRIARLVVLCAEARIAELEQQQAAATDKAEGSSSVVRDAFHQRLFALLLRYKSIQGHGFQAAAGPSVFELLRQNLQVGFECFASPLNAHFSRYGSAFPDVDGPFGSSGSFFRLQLKHGSYEANPPFVPSMLTATAQHVLALLQQAEAAAGALSFTVLMPGWEEVEGWQMLNSSPFLRKSLLVAAADHGYCDGASHQRRDLYRQSPYDSGILFLQTQAAAAKWPVREDLLQQLRDAMASCCPSAAAAERQRKQRGLTDLEWRGLGAPVAKYERDGGEDHEDAQGLLPVARQQGGAEKAAKKKKKQQEKKKRKREQQQQPQGAASQQQQQQKHISKKKQKIKHQG